MDRALLSCGNELMNVESRMAHPVITISPEETCDRAVQLMDAAAIDHLCVCEGERLVGLIQRDRLLEQVGTLLGAGASTVEIGRFLPMVRASGVMTYHPPTIAPGAPVSRAAETFATGALTALPVIDEGRLVGILTVHDLLLSIVDGKLDQPTEPCAPAC